eukprot:12538359-Ditylum_brightwellii.AAC.1
MLGYVIKTQFEVQHCLVSMCDLRLLKNRQCVTFEKGLCNCVTCRTLRNVLALKYCGEAMSELDPLFRGPTVKERN